MSTHQDKQDTFHVSEKKEKKTKAHPNRTHISFEAAATVWRYEQDR